jgi:hypothetical protein
VHVQILTQKLIIRTYSTGLVHGKRCKPDIQTVTNLILVKLCLHTPWSVMQMEQKGTRHFSLLPHRSSWGSGRWMCTCTANSRHNPPTIQNYIPNNVQRNDSSSSEDGVMGGSLDWFLLSVCSELLRDVGDDTEEQLARGDWSRWKKNKNGDTAELGWKMSFRIGGSG